MKTTFAALALMAVSVTSVQAGGMSDPVIEAPIITASAESSTLSSNAVMGILVASILWAALD